MIFETNHKAQCTAEAIESMSCGLTSVERINFYLLILYTVESVLRIIAFKKEFYRSGFQPHVVKDYVAMLTLW